MNLAKYCEGSMGKFLGTEPEGLDAGKDEQRKGAGSERRKPDVSPKALITWGTVQR